MNKLPPQNLDAEKDLLTAVLTQREAYEIASEFIRPECFYLDAHKAIYAAARSLQEKYQPIDYVTIFGELQKMGDNTVTPYDLTTLSSRSVSGNTQAHAKIILEMFLKRELGRVAQELLTESYDDTVDVFDLIEKTDENLTRINENLSFGDMIGVDRVMIETLNQVHEWAEQGGQTVTGVPTGFTELNNATRGWQPGNLIYIAARPSVGKTAFSLSLVRSAAEYFTPKKQTVAIWSLEMSRVQLGLRLLSAESETMLTKLQTGKLTDVELSGNVFSASERIGALNIQLDDTSGLTIPKLRSKARKLKRKRNLGIIFIDYLQLMEGESKGNREQEVAKISRNLKLLAKELEVPIIALAQLSREVEKRASGIPQLSDLRESGSIEQDADVVAMLYGETEAAIHEDRDKEYIKYVRIAKQRDGMLLTVPLHFDRYTQKFSEHGGNWKPVNNLPSGPPVTSHYEVERDDTPF